MFIVRTINECNCLHLLQRLKSELARATEHIQDLRQELETAKDDSATLGELRAVLDLECSHSAQLSDVIIQLQSDLASEKARVDELTR